MSSHTERLRQIKTFPQLVKYLREELDWEIESDDFEELTFDYKPEELGLDPMQAAKVKQIKQLRPLVTNQPWGIFFVSFEPKRLPLVVLRRILNAMVVRKRASANKSERPAWEMGDLLFISSYGDEAHRDVSFAHFVQAEEPGDLPTLKVLGWDDEDTTLRLRDVQQRLREYMRWPEDTKDVKAWRDRWAKAFMLAHREVINTSKDLAVQMARLAQRIRKRAQKVLEVESDKGPLRKMTEAFKEALIHDLDDDGFADMYAQTITYGLLTARVSREAGLVADNVVDMVPVTNPFLRDMLQMFLTVGGRKAKIDFDELGINDVVHALREAKMEQVLKDFGDRNPQEDPVIHFYELFLKEYDAKKRMQRGVFYTPRPVVSYIVRSVHELLQTDFGLEDGLADTTTWGEMATRDKDLDTPEGVDPKSPFVNILDPATGTATFLVEVIDLIHKTMKAKWLKQGHMQMEIGKLWNEYVPEHLLPRIHGYELLMAPYAVAHMKIGLKLWETGYRFKSDERARIYLTNALEPGTDKATEARLEDWAPALAHEARAVNEVKRFQRFTVIVGNPPYSEKSKNEGMWINSLMERYKTTIRTEEAQLKAVSNDYVKFLCMVHSCADLASEAVVGLITSNGYLDGRLFRDMRKAWVESFRSTDILNLHGSGRRGDAVSEDENVFDILQGVTISIARRSSRRGNPSVRYAEMIGPRASKYERLAKECRVTGQPLSLTGPMFLFTPSSMRQFELATWSLAEVFGTGDFRKDRNKTYAGGFKTRQDRFTVAFEEVDLRQRIEELGDDTLSEEELRKRYRLCSTAHFEFRRARKAAKSGSLARAIRRVRYRLFDDRPMIWAREVLCEPQIEVTRHLLRPNLCLATSRVVKDDSFRHVTVARGPVEVISLSNSTSTNAYMFPLYLYESTKLLGVEQNVHGRVVNLSGKFIAALAKQTGLRLSVSTASEDAANSITPEEIVAYLYAVLHSPGYRAAFADELLRDFPPIPLPSRAALFRDLSKVGNRLVALHLLESPMLNNSHTRFLGKRSSTIEKISYAGQTVWIDKKRTTGFKGVPKDVWNFHIGGYQVCLKWLKDRKGRTLSEDDINHYHKIVVALSETIRIMNEIDEVIDQHGGWPGAFTAHTEARTDD